MTDRHAGYLVTLSDDIRSDDAESIKVAIEMIKGVQMVEPLVADPLSNVAKNRAKFEIAQKLLGVLTES